MTIKIHYARQIILVLLIVLGITTSVCGIRLQMKLVGITVALAATGLLWLRNMDELEAGRDKHQVIFLIAVILLATVFVVWNAFTGPQPINFDGNILIPKRSP